mgnify:CR=1 FL=1
MQKKILGLNNKGMTLIEIMVVITILGLITAIVTVNVMDRLEKARLDTGKTQIKSLEQALEQYRLDNGSYPSTEQGIQALVAAPSFGKVPKRYPSGGYLTGGKMPKDPWGEIFIYSSPGAEGHPYEISSKGSDTQVGTEDDIKSWEE